MSANEKQVGGTHYASKFQHWDFVAAILRGRYLEGCITKYVTRWHKKNGVQDLEKAQHYLQKLCDQFANDLVEPLFCGIRFDQQCADFVNANDSPTGTRYAHGLAYEIIVGTAHWSNAADLERVASALNKLLSVAHGAARATEKKAAVEALDAVNARRATLDANASLAQNIAARLIPKMIFDNVEAPTMLAIVEGALELHQELGANAAESPKVSTGEVVADVRMCREGQIYMGIHRTFDFSPQHETGKVFAKWLGQLYTMLQAGFDKWGEAWIDAPEENLRRGLRDALAENRTVDACNYLMFLDSRGIDVAGRTGSRRLALSNRFILDYMDLERSTNAGRARPASSRPSPTPVRAKLQEH